MKKIDLIQTTQVLANLGVIAGIVFLGIEIGQNSDVMEAQTRLNLIVVENEILTVLSENRFPSSLSMAATKRQPNRSAMPVG